MNAPFVQNAWRYHAPFPQSVVFCAVREGRLESLLRANRGWLSVLAKISPRRGRAWAAVFDGEDAAENLLRVSMSQPAAPDQAYGFDEPGVDRSMSGTL